MRKYIPLLLVVFLNWACSEKPPKNSADGELKYELVSVEEFERLKNNLAGQAILLDVRTDEEYLAGTIGEAQNLDVLDVSFYEEAKQLDLNKPILIFCRSGSRSTKASGILQELGAKEIYNLEGGFLGWEESGKTK